eukprot:g6503.t1
MPRLVKLYNAFSASKQRKKSTSSQISSSSQKSAKSYVSSQTVYLASQDTQDSGNFSSDFDDVLGDVDIYSMIKNAGKDPFDVGKVAGDMNVDSLEKKDDAENNENEDFSSDFDSVLADVDVDSMAKQVEADEDKLCFSSDFDDVLADFDVDASIPESKHEQPVPEGKGKGGHEASGNAILNYYRIPVIGNEFGMTFTQLLDMTSGPERYTMETLEREALERENKRLRELLAIANAKKATKLSAHHSPPTIPLSNSPRRLLRPRPPSFPPPSPSPDSKSRHENRKERISSEESKYPQTQSPSSISLERRKRKERPSLTITGEQNNARRVSPKLDESGSPTLDENGGRGASFTYPDENDHNMLSPTLSRLSKSLDNLSANVERKKLLRRPRPRELQISQQLSYPTTSSGSPSFSSRKKRVSPKVSPSNPLEYNSIEYAGSVMTPSSTSSRRSQRTSMNFIDSQTPRAGACVRLSTEDLLEGGMSRQYLSDKCIKAPPPDQKGWKRCFVVVDRNDKTKFRMYEQDSKQFLLSAKLETNRGCFYISQYPDFPDLSIEEIIAHAADDPLFCCILRQQKTNKGENAPAYSLISRSCRHCDQSLGKYSCENHGAESPDDRLLNNIKDDETVKIDDGIDEKESEEKGSNLASTLLAFATGRVKRATSFENNSTHFSDRDTHVSKLRQRLAVITHELKQLRCGTTSSAEIAFARRISVRIPSLASVVEKEVTTLQQVVGKAKPNMKTKQGRQENINESDSDYSTVSERSDDDEEESSDLSAEEKESDLFPSGWCNRQPRTSKNTLRLVNRLPMWNRRLKSLCLRFEEGRVLESSKKNFLIACQTSEAAFGMGEGELIQDVLQGHTCIQFGKVRNKRYNLDYRCPISPVQAFSAALSMFRWLGGEENAQ